MKKTVLLLLIGLGSSLFTFAQVNNPSGLLISDTLLKQNFFNNPEPDMLEIASGYDIQWVNWDEDGKKPGYLDVPKNWYWEKDLADTAASVTNYAMTSVSFMNPTSAHNRNWMITSPIYIPDSSYSICWRSAPFQAPIYVDGYKVIVSENSNLAEDFTDTIFVAAEMTGYTGDIYSIDLNDYIYSPGYLHANGFTDTAYYYTAYDTIDGDIYPFFRCKFEPHVVSLKDYANKQIYLAFLHDSFNDNILQIDDIIISNTHTSGTNNPFKNDNVLIFNTFPNPTTKGVYLNWELKKSEPVHLFVHDITGKMLLQREFAAETKTNWYLDLSAYNAGVYNVQLATSSGTICKTILKQ